MQPRWTPKDLLKRRHSILTRRYERVVPGRALSYLISSEHYDVWDDDSDAAGDAEEAAAASTGPGPEGGATGADSTRALWGLGAEVLIRPPSYGFNDKYSGFFASLREELREMIHLPDPDNTLPSARRGLRLEHEQAAFDADRYLGDLFTEDEDPLLTEALAFEAHWQRKLPTATAEGPKRRSGLSGEWWRRGGELGCRRNWSGGGGSGERRDYFGSPSEVRPLGF
ncbi:unnamed protein product [Scytosiphon promiscuus]